MLAIPQTHEAIEIKSDDAAAADAVYLLVNIKRWKFCAILTSMDETLSAVNCLSQELLNSSIDYVAASDLIQATKTR